MKIKHKILFIILGFLFICCLKTNVKATTVNLSNYATKDLKSGVWVMVIGQETNTIYLITGERSDYPYILTSCVQNDDGSYYSTGSFVTAQNNGSQWYNKQAGTYVYKFNYDTSLFGSATRYGIGDGCFNAGENCNFIASGKNVYSHGNSTIRFNTTAVPEEYIIPSKFITLEWSFERRVDTIIMSSQHVSLEEISKYNLYYTTNSSQVENYKNLSCANIGSLKDESTDITSYFWFLSFENYFISSETYYFILEDIGTGEVAMSSMTINFNSLNDYFDEQLNQNLTDSGFSPGTSFTNGVPTLQMKYTRYMNADSTYYYQIYSQYFTQHEVTNQYVAYYTNDTSILEDYSSWSSLNIATFKDTKTGQTNYYYFFNMPSDSENTTYYFVLYNKITGQYGSVSSLTLDFDKMWEYSEQLKNDNNVVNSRFDQLIEYIKERFGFILYPFELIGEIFNRFYNINWEEPIIKIPALNVPVFGQVLTEEFTYNFNTLLDNTTIKYIHTIYIVFADVILIFAVIQFGMKVFEEVFVNG